MEEIGFRTDTFSLDGVTGSQREYVHWLLSACTQSPAGAEAILTEDAIDLLASRLRTALQIEWHLAQALEADYQTIIRRHWSTRCSPSTWTASSRC